MSKNEEASINTSVAIRKSILTKMDVALKLSAAQPRKYSGDILDMYTPH